jgi:hypothetical protein
MQFLVVEWSLDLKGALVDLEDAANAEDTGKNSNTEQGKKMGEKNQGNQKAIEKKKEGT